MDIDTDWVDVERPGMVRCYFNYSSDTLYVTLACATEGADIYYALNDNDGYYRLYNGVIEYENISNAIIYCYAEKNGLEGIRLKYTHIL